MALKENYRCQIPVLRILFLWDPHLFNHFQIYVGHIPTDVFEDTLVPLFEKSGKIWDLRLMMDPMSGASRGYAFVTYCNKEDAAAAAKTVSLGFPHAISEQ